MIGLSGAKWRKSSYSGSNACVEVAFLEGGVAVRDSKDRRGPVLRFTTDEWAEFVVATRNGDFELQVLKATEFASPSRPDPEASFALLARDERRQSAASVSIP
jgi:hypothetical protein